MVPVVLFARVSSTTQDPSRQLADLQLVADKNNWVVISTMAITVSGSKKNRIERNDIEQLVELVRARKIKKVLITEVSRLGRRSAETYLLLEELTALGVSIYIHNYGMETLLANGKRNPAASLIFMIFSEQARMETELLAERIRSGQAEARRQGKHIGRKEGSTKSTEQLKADYPKVIKYLTAGTYSIREIAQLAQVAKGTVMKVKKTLNHMS
ncbi:MAG: recombinase family protein [Sphingobacteriaceae bacterium]|jgi:DNA invertase Pin-like site-specific DNA recombinase|nr:MAG: recombinase family protein [Pedobacter sp.]